MLDSTKVETWRGIRPKDIVTLKDQQTIEDLMDDKAPGAMRGLDLTVAKRTTITADGVEWVLLDLEYEKQALFLVVKSVGEDFDVRVYFEPEDFNRGTRKDLLDADVYWLFAEPEDPDNFVPSDLDFVDEFENQDADENVIAFKLKSPSIYGEARQVPDDGMGTMFVGVAEWQADKECDNPECIAIELGGMDEDGQQMEEGGLVIFLQGANVNINDLDIMPASQTA